MTRTPEQILCCPGGCDHEEDACSAHNRTWSEGDGSAMLYRYNAMSGADRIALARALMPDGWVVVPEAPSATMLHAGGCSLEIGVRMEGPMPSSKHKAGNVYAAMVAAAKEETP